MMENKIEENYVSFENAELLKGKGLKSKYILGEGYERPIAPTDTAYNEEGELLEDDGDGYVSNEDGSENIILRPTIALAIDWIRVNFGIHIYVECDCYGEYYYPKLASASESTWKNEELRFKVNKARHYLSEHRNKLNAEQEAINYILKNLI